MKSLCESCATKHCNLRDMCKAHSQEVHECNNYKEKSNAEFLHTFDTICMMASASKIDSCDSDQILDNKPIHDNMLDRLHDEAKTHRDYNVGSSDYSKRKIQPWDIWEEYELDPWDADIIKRVLRNKDGDDPTLDYEKIKHICDKKIDMIKCGS